MEHKVMEFTVWIDRNSTLMMILVLKIKTAVFWLKMILVLKINSMLYFGQWPVPSIIQRSCLRIQNEDTVCVCIFRSSQKMSIAQFPQTFTKSHIWLSRNY